MMPNIRGRFNEFFQRQFSFPSCASASSKRSSCLDAKNNCDENNGSFINAYLNGYVLMSLL